MISYAASSALAKQIEEGAPADVFISADLAWMAYLSERDLTKKDTEVELLGNRIVLVAPADSTAAAEIAPGFDLAGLLGDDGRLAMANVDAVPAGKYGKEALTSLGVWDGVADRVAQAENVRAALALVSTGEAPLGIVYATDADADPAVKVDRHLPGGQPPADRLSGRRDRGGEERGGRGVSRLPAGGEGAGAFRGAGFHGIGAGDELTTGAAMEWLRLSPEEWTAVRLSIKVSTWATLVSLPFGILVAHVLARREFPGKAVLNGDRAPAA